MRLKYYLFLTVKNFLHKKINILNVCLLTLVITMTIVSLSFSKTFFRFIDNLINGNMNHNVIIVKRVDSIEKLKKSLSDNKSVVYVENYNSFNQYVTANNNFELELIGISDNYLEILYGQNLNNTLEEKVLICPSKFYLSANPEEYDKNFLRNLKNGKEYLNDLINIKSEGYDENYKIIGIYDVDKYTYGEYNVCFTKKENIDEIYMNYVMELKTICEQENTICSESSFKQAVVIVDNIENVTEVEEQINNLGYMTSRKSKVNTDGIDFLTFTLLLISISIFIVTFIILLISNNKFLQYNKKNNLIYKTIGYDTKILLKINYLEAIMLSIISFVIATILCFIIYFILFYNFSAEIKLQMPISVSIFSIILSIMLTLGVSLLSTYLAIKNNKSIIGEFSDVEI